MENKHFRPVGNLEDEVKNSNSAIIIDGNRNSINNSSLSSKEMEDYLLTVVSGKKYDNICEFGVLMGAGRMIISFEQLKKMVEEGYNIVSANIINTNMIEVEFQKYQYNEQLMTKWRRF